MGFSGHISLVWLVPRERAFHIWPPFNMCWEAGLSFYQVQNKTEGEFIALQMSNYIPTTALYLQLHKYVEMKLGWQQAGPSCDDARCTGTLTTSSVCDTRGLLVNGEPARHLVNTWTSSARDTHQLRVAVGHQRDDKPLNTASGLDINSKMRLDVLIKGHLLVYLSFYAAALRCETHRCRPE